MKIILYKKTTVQRKKTENKKYILYKKTYVQWKQQFLCLYADCFDVFSGCS